MKAEFGSISIATMRAEDLIPVFADTLRGLRGSLPRDLHVDIRGLKDYNSSAAYSILEELFDRLNDYAPAYSYFGAHPNDGADYGFWLCEGWEQDARDNGALFVSDTSEVPGAYDGEVVHVNDHGNATFYIADHGKLREVWAVV
jgi:hypothetical protein